MFKTKKKDPPIQEFNIQKHVGCMRPLTPIKRALTQKKTYIHYIYQLVTIFVDYMYVKMVL